MTRDSIMAIWLFVLLASVSARAHHSFAAIFDGKKPITLTGAATKIEWANPHIHLYIDVKDEAGKVINWAIEMGSPNLLIPAARRGRRRGVLLSGAAGDEDRADRCAAAPVEQFSVFTDNRQLTTRSTEAACLRFPGRSVGSHPAGCWPRETSTGTRRG